MLLLLLAAGPAVAQHNNLNEFLDAADRFFGKHVIAGKVDYNAIHNNPAKLEALVGYIGEHDRAGATEQENVAFMVNAYNLLVIHSLIEKYPTDSPLDHDGFFDGELFKVAGERMTLDRLEKKELFGLRQDARFHLVLVCGADGCPPLASFAYRPQTLEQQLELTSKRAINNNNFIRVNKRDKQVELSQIFKWYKKDFTTKGRDLMSWVNRYRDNPIPGSYSISFYEYDWSINEKKE